MKAIENLANATTTKESIAEREADEIVQVIIETYKLFGSREIIDFNNDTILQPGNLNEDFIKFIKAQKITLATEILRQSQGKKTKTNTRSHNIHRKIALGDNKNLILDPVFIKKIQNISWHSDNIITNPQCLKMKSRSSTL